MDHHQEVEVYFDNIASHLCQFF